jgi:hypothetical protein
VLFAHFFSAFLLGKRFCSAKKDETEQKCGNDINFIVHKMHFILLSFYTGDLLQAYPENKQHAIALVHPLSFLCGFAEKTKKERTFHPLCLFSKDKIEQVSRQYYSGSDDSKIQREKFRLQNIPQNNHFRKRECGNGHHKGERRADRQTFFHQRTHDWYCPRRV